MGLWMGEIAERLPSPFAPPSAILDAPANKWRAEDQEVGGTAEFVE
jgi:hypothetical protein